MLRPLPSLSSVLLLCLPIAASPQPLAKSAASVRQPVATAPEQLAIRALNAAQVSPLQLTAFPSQMPKGGDLHMHLSGAVYAEPFIRDGAADILCVNPATYSFFKPAATTRSLPPQPVCGEGNLRAESAFKDQHLYDALIDSFSMRSFVPIPCTSAADPFFTTFGPFSH